MLSPSADHSGSRFEWRSVTAGHVVDVGGEDIGEGVLGREERQVAVDEVIIEVGVESPEGIIRQDCGVVSVLEINEGVYT